MPRRRPEFWFDEAEADRVVGFFEQKLRHTDGIWAGTPFILTDWQRDEIIRPLYGWTRFDRQWGLWVRKYSRGQIWIPRGNGKWSSPLGSSWKASSPMGRPRQRSTVLLRTPSRRA